MKNVIMFKYIRICQWIQVLSECTDDETHNCMKVSDQTVGRLQDALFVVTDKQGPERESKSRDEINK